MGTVLVTGGSGFAGSHVIVQLVPLLDSTRRATGANAERVLGWQPRPREEAIVAAAESLVRISLVPAVPR
jgi:nucleoside-diphosphate-sugar epimerase